MHLYELNNTSYPSTVVDLRDPSYQGNWTDTPHILLTNSGGAIIFNYGSGNTLDWRDLYNKLTAEHNSRLQSDEMGIRFTHDGKNILISRDRSTGTWTGAINRYSSVIKEIVEQLLRNKLVSSRTKIYVGNWARRNDDDAELIGSVSNILNSVETPSKLILYHGTSNVRAKEILEKGLIALDTDTRVWNNTSSKFIPEHRDDAIYLTSSLYLARYYAKKAMNVDRQRLSYRYRSGILGKISKLRYAQTYGNENNSAKIEKLKTAHELLTKMAHFSEKIQPVILQIEITKSEYKYLMADDDYINKWKGRGKTVDPKDWKGSLDDFGQVAFIGSIPPDRIKLLN